MIERLALVEHALVAMARDVDQHRAARDTALGDRQDARAFEAADRAQRVVAVPQRIVVPHVPERVALRRALHVHEDHVVRVFDVAVEVRLAREEMALVEHVHPHRRAPARKQRLALRVADVHLQREGAALAHGGDAAHHLFGLQIIQRADFIVGAPLAPVGRQAVEQALDVGAIGRFLHTHVRLHRCDRREPGGDLPCGHSASDGRARCGATSGQYRNRAAHPVLRAAHSAMKSCHARSIDAGRAGLKPSWSIVAALHARRRQRIQSIDPHRKRK